jgi:DNA-binding NarL/FixJ family response regulator
MLIAIAMKMEAGTIKTHLKSLFTKLGASTRTEVAQLARKRGLLH